MEARGTMGFHLATRPNCPIADLQMALIDPKPTYILLESSLSTVHESP